MLLSLIMPVYNQPLVKRALDSIPLRDDIELIIVDDCSTDSTLEIINNWKDEHKDFKVIVLHNEKNMGVGYSEELAKNYISGVWSQRLDSDDYLLTDNFNELLDKLYTEFNNFDIVFHYLEDNEFKKFDWDTCAGAARVIKSNYLKKFKTPSIRVGEDSAVFHKFEKERPNYTVYDKIVYHYNWPRVGSLSWNRKHHISNEVN